MTYKGDDSAATQGEDDGHQIGSPRGARGVYYLVGGTGEKCFLTFSVVWNFL